MTHKQTFFKFTSFHSIYNNVIFFAFITCLSLLLLVVGQYLLVSDELYFNALSDQMIFEQIQQVVDQSHNSVWISYLLVVIFNLIKFTLVTSCLSLGHYFATNHWIFRLFFRVAVQSELVLLLPPVIKLFWFTLIQTDYSLNDLQFFYPLSLLNLFDVPSVSPYLLYPLQLVNLFELAYWVALAYGVSQIIKSAMPRAFGLVAASYGSGLLVWVVFVMFLTVSLS